VYSREATDGQGPEAVVYLAAEEIGVLDSGGAVEEYCPESGGVRD
jgi:hypothetical protein